jgi:conjugative relaxase-like TrwC/TraI family protein
MHPVGAFARRCYARAVFRFTKLGAGQHQYFENQVARGRDDYYSRNGVEAGEWRGRVAEAIGLVGEVDAKAFNAVLAGHDPLDPEAERELRDHPQEMKVMSYDLTFSAPKSVSVLGAIASDDVAEQLRQAHEAAVSAALEYVQDEVSRVRRGKGGLDVQKAVGLLSASYRHRMSRAKDPHLHTHVVTAALTMGSDGKWTSLDARPFYAHAKTIGTLYQAHLRAEVRERLGLSWNVPENGMAELEAFSPEILEAFSQRTMAMREAARALGKDYDKLSTRERENLALGTREAKNEEDDTEKWRNDIRARAAELGLDRDVVAAIIEAGQRAIEAPTVAPTDALDDLADRLAGPQGLTSMTTAFERRNAVLELAGRQREGMRATEVLSHADRFLDRADVLPVEGPELDPKYTTAELVATEQRLIAQCLGRAGEGTAVLTEEKVDDVLGRGDRTLNPQQRAALVGLATSGNGVDIIEARAGTGKTYMAGALREVYEAAGRRVIGVAPTGAASRTLTDEAGIASSTIHRAIADLDRFGLGLGPDVVVVLDEAGMADTRLVERFMVHAQQSGAKVVAVGDSGQLASVQAGGWLRAVGDRVGRHELTETLRQRNIDERRVLGLLHGGKPEPFLAFAEEHERLDIRAEIDDAQAAAIEDWSAAVAKHGIAKAVLITKDNAMREALNAAAREQWRAGGNLSEEHVRTFGSIEVAAGDRIICRQNQRQHDVDNGTRGTVMAVTDGQIVLQTDAGTVRGLPASYVAEHVEHAYAMTGHGMQGGTVEWAGVVATQGHLTRGWSYTALTRARERTQLYLVAGDPAAIVESRKERAASGPELEREPVDRDTILATVATRMKERDDEDLAVDQLPNPFVVPGAPGDPEVIAAVDADTPVQERGAEPAPAREPAPGQLRLASIAEEIERLDALRKSLPVREIQALDAVTAKYEQVRAQRDEQAARLEELPESPRRRSPQKVERERLLSLIASTDAHLQGLVNQYTERANALQAQTGAEPEAVRAELVALREAIAERREAYKSERTTLVDAAVLAPPRWVERELGPRPAAGTSRDRTWARGVREGVAAQLALDPTGDLDNGLPDEAPDRGREAWQRGVNAIATAAARLGREELRVRETDRGLGLDD